MEVPQAGGPYYSCCAAKQEENFKRNLNKHFLANLATELLTHSVRDTAAPHSPLLLFYHIELTVHLAKLCERRRPLSPSTASVGGVAVSASAAFLSRRR